MSKRASAEAVARRACDGDGKYFPRLVIDRFTLVYVTPATCGSERDGERRGCKRELAAQQQLHWGASH